MKTKIKIRIGLWSILVLAVFFFLYQGVVPSGRISYVYDFDKENAFIRPLSPADRTESIENGRQKIVGDPVYFSLRTPRRFDKAVLRLKYKNKNLKREIIEAGVLVDKTVWRYNLEPISNKKINQLAAAWSVLDDGGVLLIQKEKNYASLNEFLDNPPALDELAVYNYNPGLEYLLADYASSSEDMIIDLALTGSYQFYTYIKDEVLDWQFSVIDRNKNKDADEIDVFLYYQNDLIDSRHMADDGVTEDTAELSEERKINLITPGLPEGVYKIELKSNDDIITTQIKTKQNKLSFINKIDLAKEKDGEKNLRLFTDSSNLQATTIYPDRLQTISVNYNDFEISKTYQQFTHDLSGDTATNSLSLIELKDGVVISGNGVFALAPEQFINPALTKVDENLDINASGIKYVLADYDLPQKEGDWLVSEAQFDLKGAYREDGAYSFIISIPGLRADDDNDEYLEIDSISVELNGTGLVDKIKSIFKL